jgi:hypothetical protein
VEQGNLYANLPESGRFRYHVGEACTCYELEPAGITQAEVGHGCSPLGIAGEPRTAGTDPGPSPSVTSLPPLDEETVNVLLCLYDRRGHLLTVVDVADGADVSNKTAGKRLNQLITLGYANRPHGPKQGVGITPDGKRVVQLHYRPPKQ